MPYSYQITSRVLYRTHWHLALMRHLVNTLVCGMLLDPGFHSDIYDIEAVCHAVSLHAVVGQGGPEGSFSHYVPESHRGRM